MIIIRDLRSLAAHKVKLCKCLYLYLLQCEKKLVRKPAPWTKQRRSGAHTIPLTYLGNIKQFQFNTHKYRKKEKKHKRNPSSCMHAYRENCGRKEWIDFWEKNTLIDLECRSFYRLASWWSLFKAHIYPIPSDGQKWFFLCRSVATFVFFSSSVMLFH